jgi:hypothetical protein
MGEISVVACGPYSAFCMMNVVDACICTMSIAVDVKDADRLMQCTSQTPWPLASSIVLARSAGKMQWRCQQLRGRSQVVSVQGLQLQDLENVAATDS